MIYDIWGEDEEEHVAMVICARLLIQAFVARRGPCNAAFTGASVLSLIKRNRMPLLDKSQYGVGEEEEKKEVSPTNERGVTSRHEDVDWIKHTCVSVILTPVAQDRATMCVVPPT